MKDFYVSCRGGPTSHVPIQRAEVAFQHKDTPHWVYYHRKSHLSPPLLLYVSLIFIIVSFGASAGLWFISLLVLFSLWKNVISSIVEKISAWSRSVPVKSTRNVFVILPNETKFKEGELGWIIGQQLNCEIFILKQNIDWTEKVLYDNLCRSFLFIFCSRRWCPSGRRHILRETGEKEEIHAF